MVHKARFFLEELARHIHWAANDNQAHHHLIMSFSGSPEEKGGGSSWVLWGGSWVMTLDLVKFFVGIFSVIIVAIFLFCLYSVCREYASFFFSQTFLGFY